MRILYPLAKRYIAGEDVDTAIQSISRIIGNGYQCTLDILGEHTTSPELAEGARLDYLKLFELLKREFPQRSLDISIKVSQMGLDISRDLCRKNIESLLHAAAPHTCRFDMEGSAYTQATLDLCVEMHRAHPDLGQAIQVYLHSTGKDMERLMGENISIRLCKGAYKEPASVALQSMDDIRDKYRQLAFKLLKEGNQPAIATHDEDLIRDILQFVEREKIAAESFYFEMLYGVRRDLQQYLRDKGFRMRVYTPFGQAWLPYTLRRLAERKENVIFVVKHFLLETFGLGRLR